jgi:AcrR family transcriptional regulator
MAHSSIRKGLLRQQKALLQRERIMDVALRLFAAQGFAATTTKQIAQHVGITEGLLYYYFPTKVSLLMEVAKRRHTFASGMLTILQNAEGRLARDVMHEIGAGLVLLIRQEMDLVRMILSEAQTNDELYAALQEMIEDIVEQLASYLESRVAAGELRSDMPVHTTAMGFLGAFVLFFITHNRLDLQSWQAQSETYAHQWVESWYRGARCQ